MTVTTQQAQQEQAQTLAALLAVPSPDIYMWQFTGCNAVSGQLGYSHNLDEVRIKLHLWAARLDDPQWALKPYSSDPGRGQLLVTGMFQGIAISIWDGIDLVPGMDVADLAERYDDRVSEAVS